jgi:hypothetical protein
MDDWSFEHPEDNAPTSTVKDVDDPIYHVDSLELRELNNDKFFSN